MKKKERKKLYDCNPTKPVKRARETHAQWEGVKQTIKVQVKHSETRRRESRLAGRKKPPCRHWIEPGREAKDC